MIINSSAKEFNADAENISEAYITHPETIDNNEVLPIEKLQMAMGTFPGKSVSERFRDIPYRNMPKKRTDAFERKYYRVFKRNTGRKRQKGTVTKCFLKWT